MSIVTLVLAIFLIWFILSIPLGLFLGRLLAERSDDYKRIEDYE